MVSKKFGNKYSLDVNVLQNKFPIAMFYSNPLHKFIICIYLDIFWIHENTTWHFRSLNMKIVQTFYYPFDSSQYFFSSLLFILFISETLPTWSYLVIMFTYNHARIQRNYQRGVWLIILLFSLILLWI